MKGCRFCSAEITKGGVIYKDSTCYVIPSKYPIAKGHSLVISKKHFEDMLVAPDKTICDMFGVAKRVAENIKKQMKPVGIKVISNMDGAEELPHFHVHVIPVYKDSTSTIMAFRKYRELTATERKRIIKTLKLQ